jgi:hypothetical protein
LNRSIKAKIIFGIAALLLLPLFLTGPIPQDPEYHNFADQRLIYGIPNFWNVISNIPYVIIGLIGIVFMQIKAIKGGLPELKLNYVLFFIGVLLVGFGSSWYHWSPSNASLIWDRLPMTIAFMAFFSAILGEYYPVRVGKLLLWPLIFTGIVSVIYWHNTELAGQGDLRLYAAVQFLPVILIPIIMLTHEPRFKSNQLIWWFMIAYLISKIMEHYDAEILDLVSISGHTLKHFVSAAGAFLFYLALNKRILNPDCVDDYYLSQIQVKQKSA